MLALQQLGVRAGASGVPWPSQAGSRCSSLAPPQAPPAAPGAAAGTPNRLAGRSSHQLHKHPRRARVVAPRAAARVPNGSFDAEDDLDTDLAEELSRFRSPDRWNQVAQHLDLVWKVGRARGKRSVCTCCHGSGEEECAWCHGTGAMMVGDTLFRGPNGASHCPVCKGKGYVPCDNCKGTGYRATWMSGPDHCRNPI